MLLARTLGGMTVAEMLERMSAWEFGMWKQAYIRKPWGERSADLRAAMMVSAVYNSAGRQLPNGQTVSIEDCLVNWR